MSTLEYIFIIEHILIYLIIGILFINKVSVDKNWKWWFVVPTIIFFWPAVVVVISVYFLYILITEN